MTYEHARKRLFLLDSLDCLQHLIALRPQLQHRTWLRLLGELWTSCDYPSRWLIDWDALDSGTHNNSWCIDVLDTALWRETCTQYKATGVWSSRCDLMMSSAERAAYDALPENVVIYRSQGAGRLPGLSWTLFTEVAQAFHSYARHRPKEPVILHATVEKESIIALKLDRTEHEVIIAPGELNQYEWTEERIALEEQAA